MARRTAAEKKADEVRIAEDKRAFEAGRATKKSTMPERPPTTATGKKPSGMPPRREQVVDNRETPQAQLGMAETALTRVQDQLSDQMRFKENNNWNESPFYDPLEKLTAIYDAKGAVRPYDLEYDWVGFKAEVNKIGDDMFASVAQHLKDKADRMLYTGRASDEVLKQLWDEAEAEGLKPRDMIRGFSRLIKKLRAQGCHDPNEQVHGGRQQGGNRRGRG